jgi:thymidine phosphorylase
MRRVVEEQGGDPRAVDDPERLPAAEEEVAVRAPVRGTVLAIDTQGVGLAAVALGAGRSRVDEGVDHAVGLLVHKKVGDRVEAGEPFCTLLVRRGVGEPPGAVAQRIVKAYQVGDREVAPEPPFLARIA